MTIEIRQLVIRAVVQSDPDTRSGTLPNSASGSVPYAQQPAVESMTREVVLDSLVATCVRTVLRRLERSRDR